MTRTSDRLNAKPDLSSRWRTSIDGRLLKGRQRLNVTTNKTRQVGSSQSAVSMPSDAEKERCQKYRRMARAPRSPAEEAELAECVAEFRATHPSHAAALALFTISVKGLLRGRFEEFAQSELKLSKTHAHRIIRYGAFLDELCEADPTLLSTTERPPGAREPSGSRSPPTPAPRSS